MSQESRFKNIHETRDYFLKKIEQNELMSRKQKKVCITLSSTEHFLIFLSISISAFTSLLDIPIGITTSAIGLKICAIAVGIKKYMLKHDKIVLFAKAKLNSILVLISKALINSNISRDKFLLVNNVLL